MKVYPAWFKKTNTCVVFASILYKCLFSNPLASFNSLNWRVSCVFRSCKWGSSIQRGWEKEEFLQVRREQERRGSGEAEGNGEVVFGPFVRRRRKEERRRKELLGLVGWRGRGSPAGTDTFRKNKSKSVVVYFKESPHGQDTSHPLQKRNSKEGKTPLFHEKLSYFLSCTSITTSSKLDKTSLSVYNIFLKIRILCKTIFFPLLADIFLCLCIENVPME